MQFTAEELAPIEAALRDVPEGDARASALIKMAHFAHVADKALEKGEALPATEDALQKAVGAAVESARKREGLEKASPMIRVEDAPRRGRSAIPNVSKPMMRVEDVPPGWVGGPGAKGPIRHAPPSRGTVPNTTGKTIAVMRAASRARAGKIGAVAAGGAALAGLGYAGYRAMRAEKAAPATLQKRQAGTPLSEAELEQRREAGKSKKGRSLVGGAVAGAATGAALGAAASTGRRLVETDIIPRALSGGDEGARRSYTAMAVFNQIGGSEKRYKAWKSGADRLFPTGSGWPDARTLDARDQFARVVAALPSRRSLKVGAAIGAGLGVGGYVARKIRERNTAEKSLSPAALQKAIAQLPLAHRAHAEDLLKAGRVDELQKVFPAAIVAAARGLWTAANVAGTAMAARDLWRSGAKAASSYASAGRAGLRGGMAGKGYGQGQKMAYGAGAGMRRGAAGAGRMAGQAAETITTKYGPAAVRGLKSRAGVGLASGAAAGGAGAAGGAAYGASQERKNNPFTRNQQRGPRPGAPRGV